MVAAQPFRRLAGQPSGRWRAAGALATGLLLLGACAALLGTGTGGAGGAWQTSLGRGSLALGQGCPVQMCPPCPDKAETAAEEQQQGAVQEAAVLQNCPPAPDCPAAPAPPPCPACPAPIECPPSTGAGGQLPADLVQAKPGQQEQAGPGGLAAAPGPESAVAAALPLCGGPDAVPMVVDSLDTASAAVAAGVEEAFAQWAETGFTLEDLMSTADALGAWGTHDCAVWIEARKAAGPGAREGWRSAAGQGAVLRVPGSLVQGQATGNRQPAPCICIARSALQAASLLAREQSEQSTNGSSWLSQLVLPQALERQAAGLPAAGAPWRRDLPKALQ